MNLVFPQKTMIHLLCELQSHDSLGDDLDTFSPEA
jgi:hypothetical protein